MVMSISDNKQITVNNETFSFQDFKSHPEIFIPKVEHLFREKTLLVKEGESYKDRLTRLFYLLYYTKGLAATTNTTRTSSTRSSSTRTSSTTDEFAILNTLGIDLIKHCPKTSKIIFKNSGKECKIKNSDLEELIQSIKSNNKIKHPKKKIKFGVELEFVAQYSAEKISLFSEKMEALVGKDRYNCILQYHHNKGNQWELGRDGSVRARGKRGYLGFELTSPILSFNSKKDLKELEQVIELIKTVLHGEINRTCGTHVHMSFPCEVVTDVLKKHFAKSYRISEDTLFDKIVPVTRREDNNRYCRSVNEYHISDRYRKLNLCHAKNDSDSMHLEFRQLAGTIDYTLLLSWIKLQKLFIEFTMSNLENSKSLYLKDVICDKSFDGKDVENLLTMGKIVA